MFAFGVVAKTIVCAKLLLVLGYFITRSELSREPSSKQLHHSGMSLDPLIDASDKELLTITQEIWAADDNRMKDDEVKYNTKEPYVREKTFFKPIKPKFSLKNKPTYANLTDLLFNYPDFAGTNMSRDADLLDKENAFLDAILETKPIEKLYKWLVQKGLSIPKTFKESLRQYWFKPYYRAGGVLSSGFKHTFVGETYWDRQFNPPKPKVNGLHNWVRMYYEDKAGRLQVTHRPKDSHCEPAIEDVGFNWKPIGSQTTYRKDTSSLFIRTSPEVEIALYTLCLLTRPNVCCYIQLKSNNKEYFRAITTKVMPGLELTIGTAFPSCNCP